jgi:hypothetical protein
MFKHESFYSRFSIPMAGDEHRYGVFACVPNDFRAMASGKFS